ncbi:hypothetical protein PtA15_9A202 [Puccinia triticina]|uniref:Uncharacterized protein n=1 Tax=Puccinia triticina TaxID=208348 RepID=A0ABY7CZE9_9BASI|nr:uncharacterized protein PtA15_9A202 [Puccinia triticina]WAQ88077.1 hypothetical protein PtA15_9A202 [Puccinia triticina]
MEYSYDTIYYYVYALPPTFSSPAAEDHRQRLPATFLGRFPTRLQLSDLTSPPPTLSFELNVLKLAPQFVQFGPI